MTNLEKINKIKESISKSIIGQDHLVNRLVMVLLSDGNMLLEGLPGLAKTRAVKSLSNVIEAGLSRIQFTPDLLPSDVTGTEIYMPDSE
ncbi:MAG: AAA family ATPase, partial [Flavobacteriales bacterium]|nr:AAA family ATPase [Flavobacteriales bacterium]